MIKESGGNFERESRIRDSLRVNPSGAAGALTMSSVMSLNFCGRLVWATTCRASERKEKERSCILLASWTLYPTTGTGVQTGTLPSPPPTFLTYRADSSALLRRSMMWSGKRDRRGVGVRPFNRVNGTKNRGGPDARGVVPKPIVLEFFGA